MDAPVATCAPEGPLFAYGFSARKRSLLKSFTQRSDIRWIRDGAAVQPGAGLLLWGSGPVPARLPQGVRLTRVEDGFLRSVGLGADLTRPLSWVFDDVGMYYDQTQPSALENLLGTGCRDAPQLIRAAKLRERIVLAGLTKYNLEARSWKRPDNGRLVVLVPGQVETDASIAYGTVDVRTNLDLLKAVRAERPQAWVVYKPHPDVVAGLRHAGRQEDQVGRYCDEVIQTCSMHDLLQQVDEVHLMTSLTGFEALMRGKPVFCYGLPFYAGYGLTHDRHRHPRRAPGLTLDALVACALIEYPVYLSRVTKEVCPPEQVLDELIAWREARPHGIAGWRKWLRPLISRA